MFIGKPTTNGAANVVVEEAPQSVLAFDELIDGTFQQFKDLSAKCGSDVKTMVRVTYLILKLDLT